MRRLSKEVSDDSDSILGKQKISSDAVWSQDVNLGEEGYSLDIHALMAFNYSRCRGTRKESLDVPDNVVST